ncbi:MAG: extracellular solute-binding protein, partial [Gammaproteobacteria bacterium]|nr:extracellular solute-binding protein [Gammaproteobacteria bacterium]
MRFLTILIICASALTSITVKAEEILIYSGRSDKFVKPVVAEFTKQTGIKVTLHTGSSTSLLNKLQLEKDKTRADIYISNDAGNLQKGASLGLFRTIPGKITQHVPNNYRASNDHWVGLSARARVLVANKNDPLAKDVNSIFDLASSKFKGKLGITHSANESYIAGVTVYMQAAGKEKTRKWLEGMKNNVSGSVFNKHSKIVKAVAKGKKSVGLVNHYYIYRHLKKDPQAPIRIVLPDQGKSGMGVAWNVAGAAISKHSKNTQAAEKFLQFVISKQGQRLFAEVNNEYPVRP